MLTKDDLHKIKSINEEVIEPKLIGLRSEIALDIRVQLTPIKVELEELNAKIEHLRKVEDDDAMANFHQIEALKKRVNKLEKDLASLKK